MWKVLTLLKIPVAIKAQCSSSDNVTDNPGSLYLSTLISA